MVYVDYNWFLNANPGGHEEGNHIVVSIFTGPKNSTIRNIDLLIPKLISGEVNVAEHTLSMGVSEA